MKRVLWSKDDIRLLKKHARKKSAKRIARKLHRTEGAVRHKAWTIGVSLETRV